MFRIGDIRPAILAAAIVAANTAVNAASPITAFPYDDFMLIDGVWRVVQGQHAGIDVYNPIGFGLFNLAAVWWQWLGRLRLDLVLAGATVGLLIGGCPVVASRGLSDRQRIAVLQRCRIRGIGAQRLWMVVFHDRPGRLLQPTDGCRIDRSVPALVERTACGAGRCGVHGAAPRHSVPGEDIRVRTGRADGRFGVSGTVLLLLLAVAVEMWCSGTMAAALFRDYAEAAAARRQLTPHSGVSAFSAFFILSVLVLTVGAWPLAVPPVSAAIVIGAYFILQSSLNISNTEPPTIYLAPAAAAALWIMNPQRKSLLLSALAVIVLLPQAAATLVGSALAVGVPGLPRPIAIAGADLVVSVLPGVGDGGRAAQFARSTNQGLALLRRLDTGGKAIATLDYVNPFPALLGTPPPKGVPVVWAIDYMQTPAMADNPPYLFGDACLVAVPAQSTPVVEASNERLKTAAAPFLVHSFEIAAQEGSWTVFRKKKC